MRCPNEILAELGGKDGTTAPSTKSTVDSGAGLQYDSDGAGVGRPRSADNGGQKKAPPRLESIQLGLGLGLGLLIHE